jgi:hypothetical protein
MSRSPVAGCPAWQAATALVAALPCAGLSTWRTWLYAGIPAPRVTAGHRALRLAWWTGLALMACGRAAVAACQVPLALLRAAAVLQGETLWQLRRRATAGVTCGCLCCATAAAVASAAAACCSCGLCSSSCCCCSCRCTGPAERVQQGAQRALLFGTLAAAAAAAFGITCAAAVCSRRAWPSTTCRAALAPPDSHLQLLQQCDPPAMQLLLHSSIPACTCTRCTLHCVCRTAAGAACTGTCCCCWWSCCEDLKDRGPPLLLCTLQDLCCCLQVWLCCCLCHKAAQQHWHVMFSAAPTAAAATVHAPREGQLARMLAAGGVQHNSSSLVAGGLELVAAARQQQLHGCTAAARVSQQAPALSTCDVVGVAAGQCDSDSLWAAHKGQVRPPVGARAAAQHKKYPCSALFNPCFECLSTAVKSPAGADVVFQQGLMWSLVTSREWRFTACMAVMAGMLGCIRMAE